ncbi:TetR/AcrR family transcriptional regulator [Nocardia callitridis]|uniref:TetR/AcrR family transcriptional regulator n=1 Tax=Nocardia callitridis TaxID=648753 RepID=A0ABP9K6I7_9NOCA
MTTTHSDGAAKPRRRDAAATRQALLTAARVRIAEQGVEATSTRDVAAEAGVNQALVYRYFGSKEKLFAEAVGGAAATPDPTMMDSPLPDLPRALLDHALDVSATGRYPSSFSALATGANDDTMRTILKDRIEFAFGTQLSTRLTGPDPELRAELVAALITGIGLLRGKVGTRALATADRDTLATYVDLMTQSLLGPDENG